MLFTRQPNPRPGSYRFAEPLHGVQSAFGAFKAAARRSKFKVQGSRLALRALSVICYLLSGALRALSGPLRGESRFAALSVIRFSAFPDNY